MVSFFKIDDVCCASGRIEYEILCGCGVWDIVVTPALAPSC